MKRGSKSLAYRVNRYRLRHKQYGAPVSTIVGTITPYDQWLAHMYLSGQWSWEEYDRRKGK